MTLRTNVNSTLLCWYGNDEILYIYLCFLVLDKLNDLDEHFVDNQMKHQEEINIAFELPCNVDILMLIVWIV